MRAAFFVPCALLLGAAIPAQISIAMSAVVPITIQSGTGANTSSQTLPAGPLGASSYITTSSIGSDAWTTFAHTLTSNAYSASGTVFFETRIGSTAANQFATTNQIDVLLEFSSPTATPTVLEVVFAPDVSPGAPMPSTTVDVGNDGLVDFINGQQTSPGAYTFVVGPQPLQIRVRGSTSLNQLGTSGAGLSVQLRPQNDLSIEDVYGGCFQQGGGFGASPTFVDRGVDFGSQHVGSLPKVTVFGFQSAPLLLPASSSGFCLLVPSPDIVIAGFTFQTFSVPLPQSVRPVDLWAQSVFLTNGQLQPTNAVRVNAW